MVSVLTVAGEADFEVLAANVSTEPRGRVMDDHERTLIGHDAW
jgi:hypothetical protein